MLQGLRFKGGSSFEPLDFLERCAGLHQQLSIDKIACNANGNNDCAFYNYVNGVFHVDVLWIEKRGASDNVLPLSNACLLQYFILRG